MSGTSNTALARALGVPTRDLISAIGGPWWSARPVQGSPTQRFMGRAGPSVLLEIDPEAGVVRVGVLIEEWLDPGTIDQRMDAVTATIALLTDDAVSPQRFLSTLGDAVDAAYAVMAPSLGICRYCGEVMSPAHMFRVDECHGCGSDVHFIVY